jgi:predicted acetyltransferase
VEYEIRPCTADEFPEFLRATGVSFGEFMTDESIDDERLIAEYDRSLGVLEAGRWVGTAGAYSFDLALPGGTTAPVAGVTWVAVHPTHRRRGLLTAMMDRQLDDVAARGEPIAILTASEAVIYGRYGYGVASEYVNAVVDVRRAAMDPEPAAGGRIRLVGAEEAGKVMPGVFDAYRVTRPGEITRNERWWELNFRDRERWRHGASANFYAVHETDAGEVDGYARYRVKDTWSDTVPGNTLLVTDVVATDLETEAELWRYLFDIDLLVAAEMRVRPVDDWLRRRLRDSRGYRVTAVNDFLWLRLVDITSALAARRYSTDDSLRFEVVDPFRPANDGVYVLEGGPDGAEARRGGAADAADLALDVGDLGAAYLGGVPFTTLARAHRVEERTPGALARADALFRCTPAPFCRTGF